VVNTVDSVGKARGWLKTYFETVDGCEILDLSNGEYYAGHGWLDDTGHEGGDFLLVRKN